MSDYDDDSFSGTDTSSSQSSSESQPTLLIASGAVMLESSLGVLPPVPVPVPVQEERAEMKNIPLLPLDNAQNVPLRSSVEESPVPPITVNPPDGDANNSSGGGLLSAAPPITEDPSFINASVDSERKKSSVDVSRKPTMGSTDKTFLDTEMTIDEPDSGPTEHFQELMTYVAFAGTPSGSMGTHTATRDTLCGDTRESVAVEEPETPTPTPAVILPVETRREEVASRAGSSDFSTLSQHLTKTASRGNESNSAALLREAASAAVAAILPAAKQNGAGLATSAAVDVAPLLAAPVNTSQTQPTAPVAFSSPKDACTLPRLPPAVGTALPSLPPPLPSRDPQQDPRIVELRETSEAVERLVRSFALLRGHVGASSPDMLEKARTFFDPKETEKLSSLRLQHGVGDAATVQTSKSSIRRTLAHARKPVADEPPDDNMKVALEVNEAELEDAIMCLVMELMQRDAKQPFEENTERKAIHPSFELVGVDNFKSFQPSVPRSSRPSAPKSATTFSIFDGGMQAFAPGDADASESLYHSVLQGLQKYVWSHVSMSARHANSQFPPAGAPFAWVLQLDLLLVCMQILESRFAAGERAGTKDGAAVWIQYEGPREAESLSRNAVHCLPFEVLDARQHEKPVFRLEYWVTKEKMWRVVEAVAASIREGVVAHFDGYRVFSSDDEIHIDPDALLPTRVPLFSLVAPERLKKTWDDEMLQGGTRKGISHGDEEKPNINFFHIKPETLEFLAHAVSTVSTEFLEIDSKTSRKNYRQSYQDATTMVSEALCELLEDPGIRAAVQRRAKAKIMELAKQREVDTTVDRHEKERRLIETAEAEAERVVQKIMQEMRVEEGKVL